MCQAAIVEPNVAWVAGRKKSKKQLQAGTWQTSEWFSIVFRSDLSNESGIQHGRSAGNGSLVIFGAMRPCLHPNGFAAGTGSNTRDRAPLIGANEFFVIMVMRTAKRIFDVIIRNRTTASNAYPSGSAPVMMTVQCRGTSRSTTSASTAPSALTCRYPIVTFRLNRRGPHDPGLK